MSERRARPSSATVIAVVSLAVMPLPVAPMLPPVLALQAVIGFVMQILKIAVELTMLPWAETLLMGLVMFLVELVMDIVVTLVETVVLPVVPALPVLRHRGRRKTEKRDRAGCGKYNFADVILLHGTIPC